jgi:2-polyprenyl-3-methyl-5-hydroxy-6-metoxy-1,4-benzoquinol methylase
MSVPDCEICGGSAWTPLYEGAIRDGAFGSSRPGAIVRACGLCQAGRLDPQFCVPAENYESAAYRQKLQQTTDLTKHRAMHDPFQIFGLEVIWPRSLRALTVADIGCGGGSFLDHVRSIAKRTIAIEPNTAFQGALRGHGIETFSYASDAARGLGPIVDLAVSFQVIEHTDNPREFLSQIYDLLAPQGELLVSTPNAKDILLDLLPESFRPFFYRTVHKWYFDAASLGHCARRAGFEVENVRHVHRYPLSNALAWLRDRKPSGFAALPGIEPVADAFWKAYLEQVGRSDTLFMWLRKV